MDGGVLKYRAGMFPFVLFPTNVGNELECDKMRVMETSQEEACWGRQAKERRYLYQPP